MSTFISPKILNLTCSHIPSPKHNPQTQQVRKPWATTAHCTRTAVRLKCKTNTFCSPARCSSRKGSDRGSSTKKPTPTRPPRSSSSNFSQKSSRNNSDNSDTDSGGLSRGTAVEARYRGGSRYYPGKISRDNRNGTYDIDYDDGEKEKVRQSSSCYLSRHAHTSYSYSPYSNTASPTSRSKR